MIRLIEGTVAAITVQGVIIQTSGIGYLVYTTSRVAAIIGSPLRLYTHLAVRETALDLYGFATEAELTLFELLLGIPKIGPKSGLQIMQQADSKLIHEAVTLQDPDHLSKLSGMGKKTAEKVVLALKDKLALLQEQSPSSIATTSMYQDAFDTLLTLGYNPMAVRQVLDSLPKDDTTSSLVKAALRELS